MSFFDDLDRRVEAQRTALLEARVVAREMGYGLVKLAETGVWSAKPVGDWSKNGDRAVARSQSELLELMRATRKAAPKDPKKLLAQKRRLAEYRERLLEKNELEDAKYGRTNAAAKAGAAWFKNPPSPATRLKRMVRAAEAAKAAP